MNYVAGNFTYNELEKFGIRPDLTDKEKSQNHYLIVCIDDEGKDIIYAHEIAIVDVLMQAENPVLEVNKEKMKELVYEILEENNEVLELK